MAPHICCVIHTQARLTNRAVELLALPEDDTPKLLLDIGCGSGLSGEQLTEMVSWESWVTAVETMTWVVCSHGLQETVVPGKWQRGHVRTCTSQT